MDPSIGRQLDRIEDLQRRRRTIERQIKAVSYAKGICVMPQNRQVHSALIRLQSEIDREIAQHAILAAGQI